MDIPLSQEDAVTPFWLAYKKTPEYKRGLIKAIPAHHPLVEKQEREGLQSIYTQFIKSLSSTQNAKAELKSRSVGTWLNEWKNMQKMLFMHILKDCGNWRKKDVRFGSPGDEEVYHIPSHRDVPREMTALANTVCQLVNKDLLANEDKYRDLAQVHYQFIRIHPFVDGNGRIARVLTDQLAIFFGLPPAMAGYPRHDDKRRLHYHKAIRACVDDPSCGDLALWIAGYIEEQLKLLA